MINMKKLKRLLRMALLFPILLIIGAVGEGGGAEGGGAEGNNSNNSTSGDDDNTSNNNNSEERRFTQAELDAAIEKRLKRERQKWEKLMKQQTSSGSGEGDDPNEGDSQPNNEAESEAAKRLEEANKKLVEATATTEAVKLGVDPKYVADVVKLADLTEVMDEDGNVKTAEIAKKIDEVLKRIPHFKLTAQTSGGFKVGAGDSQQQNKGAEWNKQPAQKRWNRFNQVF